MACEAWHAVTVAEARQPVTAKQLVDAFYYPPRLLPVAHRSELSHGNVLIVSHVELWPWRTSVRGGFTDGVETDRPTPRIAPTTGLHHSKGPLSEWIHDWVLTDDADTVYLGGGASTNGNVIHDFIIDFAAPVPAAATALTITTPVGTRIEVRV